MVCKRTSRAKNAPALVTMYLLCALAWTLLIGAGAASAAERSPFSDIPPGHWAYDAVKMLAEKGILGGYPDGTFRGRNLVTRYALALTLARAIQSGALSGEKMASMSDEDLKRLKKLLREFSDELSMLGVKTASLEERCELNSKEIRRLDMEVSALKRRTQEKDTEDEERKLELLDGEFRLRAYNREDMENEALAIVNVGFKVEDIEGKIGFEYINVFDQNLETDKVTTYEAYADFTSLPPLERLRVGRFNDLVGCGLTLYDRIEGFSAVATPNDMYLELASFDALMAHVSSEVLPDLSLGFYYIRQDKTNNRQPTHTGLYLKGKIRRKVAFGFEYAEYDNDGVSPAQGYLPANNDLHDKAWLLHLRWKQSRNLSLRVAYAAADEDYRAFKVDSDLRYHNPDYSILEDTLQAIRDATPSYFDPDQINGFKLIKIGADFELPNSPWRARFDYDMLNDNSDLYDNSDDEFDILTLAFSRDLTERTSLEIRYQGLFFDHENPADTVDTIPALSKKDRSTIRAQLFVRF